MEEIKKTIKELTPANALNVYSIFAGITLLFYLVIPQYCIKASLFGISESNSFGFFKIGDIFGANVIMGLLMIVNLLLPLVALFVAFTKKEINEKLTYAVVGFAFISGILALVLKASEMGISYANFGIAFGWILNLIIGVAWCLFVRLRNN